MVPTKKFPDPSAKDKAIILYLEEDSRHHWNKHIRVKWAITYFFGIYLVYSVRVSMSICAPAIGKDLGWNKQISGIALSAFFCGYVTTNVLGGYLADRHGGEIVIFYSGIIWSTLTTMLPMLAQSESLPYSGTVAVLLTRFLTGVSQGVFFPSIISILTKHVAVEDRAFVYSFANSGSALGIIMTGFVGSLLIEHASWHVVFVLIGVLALLWTIWMKYLYTTTGSNAKEKVLEKVTKKEPVPWLKLASSSKVWALVIAYFCNSLCFFNLLSWTPVYFHDAFPQSKGWVFNVIPWLVCFTLTNISGYVANVMLASGSSVTFVRKMFASMMYIGMALFSLLLNSVETFHQALFVMSLNIGVSAFSSCSIALNAQDLAPRHAGALHGFVNSCGAFAGFVGVYITGYILETTGQWQVVFLLTSGVSFCGFLCFLIFGSGERVV